MTTIDLPLSCTCGAVSGTAVGISPRNGNRVICMCDDCQAFAEYLGRSDDMLDAHGGTDIFQMTPAQLRITEGVEHLRCVRLSSSGLLRWHTQCCSTPVGNTMASPKVPFVGVPHLFMDHGADGRSREEAIGPVIAKVHGRFCRGEMPADAHAKFPPGLMVRTLRLLALAWLRRRHTPTPFFDPSTKRLVTEPEVLSSSERRALEHSAG